MTPLLLLASNSPRRRKLLALTGWEYDIRPVDIDESPRPGEPPTDYVLRLCEEKARAAAPFAQDGQVVLAADTTVADGMRILGKPTGADEARQMLTSLRGRDHMVYTAIAAYQAQTRRMSTDLCGTRVWMRDYSDEEMEAYIASGDPFDKAGAYAIQHQEFHPVERIEGCYGCVVGLSICRVVWTMRGFGINPPNEAAGDCQQELNVYCDVFKDMLGPTL